MRPRRLIHRTLLILPILIQVVIGTAVAQRVAGFPAFKEHVINPDAGTGLAITVADVDGDGLPDIVGVSSRDVAWYENPTWTRHLIADTIEGSNVCIDANDVDGDGLPEFALGADWQFNNTDSGGALYLLTRGDDVRKPWTIHTLIEELPTLHRIRWADVTGDTKKELVVAPLKGPGSKPPTFQEMGVKLLYLRPPATSSTAPWPIEVIDESLHVVHNVWPAKWNGSRKDAILAASFEGISLLQPGDNATWTKVTLARGNPDPLPQSGAGEIKTASSPVTMLATIEPWHGHQAVVYTPTGADGRWLRHVLDDTLRGGHAVWWADFDGDNEEELLVGFREKAGPKNLPGLNVYDLRFNGGKRIESWTKHVIDDGGMATEDALAADLNQDGRPDIVAFGRASHNIKYYENLAR